jgi:hypothetical protein
VTLPCKTVSRKLPEYELEPELRLQIRDSVSDISREDWDHVVGEKKVFMQYAYLESLEQLAPPNVSYRYAIICSKGRPVWAGYFQILRFNQEALKELLKPIAHSHNYVGLITGMREWLTKESSERSIRVLISGNCYISGEYGQSMVPDIDPAAAFEWLAETVRILLRTERDDRAISLVLVKDYYEPLREPSKRLRRSRFYEFFVEPEMIVKLNPDWQTFEDYLAAMSKKYRNRARAVRRKTQNVTQENWDAATVTANEALLYGLYLNVHKSASFRLSVLPPAYFSTMKNKFPELFQLHVYKLNGEVIGFRTSFLQHDALEAHYIGLDYSVNREYSLYQAILYDLIEEGIGYRAGQVYLGRTASEIKSTVGATAHPLTCYIRHRNSLSNQLIRPFLEYLKPSDWIPRNPFKEEDV